MKLQTKNFILWVIGLGVIFPLFFQLNGNIYSEIHPTMDSHGVILTLPLPVSILVCLLGLALLVENLSRGCVAILIIFGTIAVSVISLLLGSDGATPHLRKLIAIVQIVLPLIGLLLGQMIDDDDKIVARAFLVVISVVVPLQLLATWLQGRLILTQYLYWFSIYSHFQYVTLIFVSAYAYCLSFLWKDQKTWLCIIALPMFLYVLAGMSFLTIFAFLSVLAVLLIRTLWMYRANIKMVVIVAGLTLFVFFVGITYFEKMFITERSTQGKSGIFVGKFKSVAEGNIPVNLQERIVDWKLFLAGIGESNKTLWLGHPQPMPREIRTSPHNWYIDIVYTFGIVALLPILGLMGYTTWLCFTHRKKLSGETWLLLSIVFYLVVVDSNFKVTLRQPYPGIFAYFLWGLLLSRLRPNVKIKMAAKRATA